MTQEKKRAGLAAHPLWRAVFPPYTLGTTNCRYARAETARRFIHIVTTKK
jgi:hypothetical protein